jgi:hypothetical protein
MRATSLTLYPLVYSVNPETDSERLLTGHMKTTMMFRPIANPRRTRLAALKDAEPQAQAAQDTAAQNTEVAQDGEQAAQAGAGARPLPQQTANPRRTILSELPASGTPAE